MPEKLVNMLFYLIGMHFALSACEEHKALKVGAWGQLKVKFDDQSQRKYLEYMEHRSKSFQGGFKSLHNTPKTVWAFENVDNPARCLVCIYKKYLAKQLSHDPKCSKDLYLHPLVKPPSPHVWYSCQPLGVGTLSKVISKLCDVTGIHGKYSNHSLRSTAATHMYDQQVDEQQITEVTGHKSVAVRKYKHTSMEKQKDMSEILYGKWKKNVSSTISKPPDSSFELSVNSQMDPVSTKTKDKSKINVNIAQVHVNAPVINIDTPKITVNPVINPVINLWAQDLIQKSDGRIELPEISVNMMININWTFGLQNVSFELCDVCQKCTDSPYWTVISTIVQLIDWKLLNIYENFGELNLYPIKVSWDQRSFLISLIKLPYRWLFFSSVGNWWPLLNGVSHRMNLHRNHCDHV